MATTTEFAIVTPGAIKIEGKAEIVVAPGVAGDLAALANHAPMLTTLRIGVVRATLAAGQENAGRAEYAINGGFMQILPNKVVVLTDVALSASEVDADAARAELRLAEEQLTAKRGVGDKVERDAVAWARARLEVAHKAIV